MITKKTGYLLAISSLLILGSFTFAQDSSSSSSSSSIQTSSSSSSSSLSSSSSSTSSISSFQPSGNLHNKEFPLQLKGKIEGNYKVILKWTPSTMSNIQNYIMYVSYKDPKGDLDNHVWDINKTIKSTDSTYTDWSAKKGMNFYRICAVSEDENMECSNVIQINMDGNGMQVYDQMMGKNLMKPNLRPQFNTGNVGMMSGADRPYMTGKNSMRQMFNQKPLYPIKLSEKIKKKVDDVFEKYVKKIEAKYSNKQDQISKYKLVVNNIEKFIQSKKNVKQIPIYDYLRKLLLEKIAELETDDNVDLDEILTD